MRVALFCHSLLSCWNHGNAHFLRGIVGELEARGHSVRAFEPRDGWSVRNLVEDCGERALDEARAALPGIDPIRYDLETLDVDEALDGCDVVLVHEWTDPSLVGAIGRWRAAGGRAVTLFHDTHHRAVTSPHQIDALALDAFDGVLAFGEAIRDVYQRRGWSRRVFTWHEAADVRRFMPLDAQSAERAGDVVWVGNWGDEERTRELAEYFLDPVETLGLRATAYGVRYPGEGRRALTLAGVAYGGFLPNWKVPAVYARYAFTVHVPRRPYVERLPGIPTIRPFEALACGIPLVSAPWQDTEGLFTAQRDYLVARDGAEMRGAMRALAADDALRRELAAHGRETILARHTCAHRVDELFSILGSLGVAVSGENTP
ncbi:MAG: glycosyltransferase [Polyangiaceae bacterium]|nr:glycosyltransferase [Polyangiaceae bacterium]